MTQVKDATHAAGWTFGSHRAGACRRRGRLVRLSARLGEVTADLAQDWLLLTVTMIERDDSAGGLVGA
ncbi:hypothetical protein [Deinococcus reticulitermitis]|uniref:hypothetical protein n=1 Tax=Deinococcus reticulitermitis TaxID=856736 RepID=UPI0011604E91|nr:hypothetical protein [Deinococcus reticulitermitis]